MPATFERRWEDNPVHDNYYPQPGSLRADYREGVFVGYRGYETKDTKPLFAFGHGLSYTRFKYDAPTIRPMSGEEGRFFVEFDVTNIGERAGATVAQVYVSPPPGGVPRPRKELEGFAKILLQPGKTQRVSIPLGACSFAYYDTRRKHWRADPGTYRVLIGDSSDHADLTTNVTLGRPLVSR